MKKAKPEPVVVVTHRARPADKKEWHDYLDEAVEKMFSNISCNTDITAKGYATRVLMKDGSKLMPALQKRVSAFIKGWMACEDSYQ